MTGTFPAAAEESVGELAVDFPLLGTWVVPQGESVWIAVYLREDASSSAASVARRLRSMGGCGVAVARVDERDWLAAFRENARPLEIGRTWWVDPHPHDPSPAPTGRKRLVVEPRMAFGSGGHESTQLVLLELEDRPPAGLDVLDVGTGSGILAFAAERLGAGRVVGLDIDEQAVFVARQIARQQEWAVGVELVAGSVDAVKGRRFGRVLCNMIAADLVPLLPRLRELLDPPGEMVLSGFLVDERSDICEALTMQRVELLGDRVLGDWLSLRVRRARGRG